MSLRVVYFGNADTTFSNRHFDALNASSGEVVAVVDVPPARRVSTGSTAATVPASGAANLVDKAQTLGIPVFAPASPNQPEFVAAMAALCPDLFIAVGYLNLLRDELLAVPRLPAVNFHASLLPAYRGKHPLFWALRNDERRTGLTVHVMSPGIDTGDILYQVSVATRRDDSVAALYDRIMERSVGLVARLLADAEAGTLRARPQASEGASYYSSVSIKDFRLDWDRPAEELRRWICTSPGQCFSELAGEKIFVSRAELTDRAVLVAPPVTAGQIVAVGRRTCTVATGEGTLCLQSVRRGEGVETPAAQLCRDLGLRAGDMMRSSIL